MWLPGAVAWFLLGSFCLEQAHGLRPEDERKASESSGLVEETGQSNALAGGNANPKQAKRQPCGTTERDQKVNLSSLQNCIQNEQKRLSEAAEEIIAAGKAVNDHQEATPAGWIFVGNGYCRDSTCQDRASCSHPWSQTNLCASLSQCQHACNGCAAISWSAKPPDNHDSCRSRSLSRCVVYRGSSIASTTSSNQQEYSCYRPKA
eukprot:TRINITY_DN4292_c0_g1_i1.p1 TRINITY_DN4292_c0_g1~~TRINITY_DN4292_c0_g1_i1.p1  ORF type:complete len:205 (+),score=17.85 TRINITY_DN4292_c0_g1_i1:67-681(+)